MFPLLTFVAATCVLCYGLLHLLMWHARRRHLYELASKFDGPPALPLIGNAHSLIGDGEHVLNKLNEFDKLYPSLCRVWVGPMFCVAVTDPQHIEEICRNPTTQDKGEEFKHFAGAFLGTGLFTAPVSKWRVSRKLIQPTFNKKILDSYVKIFATQAKIYTEQLEKNSDGPEFEVFKLLSPCTLDMICESVMGVKIGAQRNGKTDYIAALRQVVDSIRERFFSFWLHPDFIFYRTKLGRTHRENLKYLHNFTDNVIETRRNELPKRNGHRSATIDDDDGAFDSGPERKACLDYLLRLTDDVGEFSNQELRDEVNTFIAAGNDPSARTIAFMMLMLASHPDLQDKAYQELYEIYGDADVDERPVTSEDLVHLKYLERVIKETLRLFPSAPFIVRRMSVDLDIGGHILPSGSYAAIGILHLQRKEKYWPDPLKFDPDRFSPEECAKRHPYAFMAFSGGPRNCIGLHYSIMSMKTVMATFLRRYTLKKDHIVPIKDIRLAMEMFMRPVEPIKLRIERRRRNDV